MMDGLNEVATSKVLVIHGFTCHRFWLQLLCWRLRRKGYAVENWGYKSLFQSIQVHADALHDHLVGELAGEQRIDIVAHSMGSLVLRAALSRGNVKNLGRVVLLAPPSRGTPVARYAALAVGRICPCVLEMSSKSTSFAMQLQQTLLTDVGVIAARFDTLVPNAYTHIDDECEHTTLLATHNSLLFSGNVADLIHRFLRAGSFKKR